MVQKHFSLHVISLLPTNPFLMSHVLYDYPHHFIRKGGVGILVKDKQCESVVEIRKCDRIMTMCLIFQN